MSKKKVLLILSLFLLVLTCIRVPWVLSFTWHPNQIKANQGVLDLQDWDTREDTIIPLDGEWTFYPNSFLTPNDLEQLSNQTKKVMIPVPSNWNSYFADEPDSSKHYGTYHLRIVVTDEQAKKQYKLQLPRKAAASKIYINNELVINNDLETAHANKIDLKTLPRAASFTANQHNEIDILIQFTQLESQKKGGIVQSIKFGEHSSINLYNNMTIASQLLIALIALLHVLYSIIIFFLRRQNRSFLYFALAIFSAAVATLLDDDKLLLRWLSIDYIWSVKLLFLAYLGIAAFVLLFVQTLFSEFKNNKIVYVFNHLHIIIALLLICAPAPYVSVIATISFYDVVLAFFTIAFILWRSVRKGKEDVLFLLLASASGTSSFAWAFYKAASSTEIPYYPVDIIVALLAFSIYLFKRSFRTSDQNQELATRLQKEIEKKDSFLTNTSHELRNPLHGIINIAQSLLQNQSHHLNKKSEKDITLLVTIGRHMSRTLDDLLDITRLKEHRIQLQKEQLDIHSVILGIIDMFNYMIDNKNVQLNLQIPSDFPYITADKNRLIQIMFNLLHNAVKFTEEGEIIIKADTNGDRVTIHVMDTGVGISEAMLGKIFEPYEQGDSSITAIGGGLGLGLSICRQLVELHGGTLTASSIVNEGSLFSFTLPLDGKTKKPFPLPSIQTGDIEIKTLNMDTLALDAAFSAYAQNPALSYKPRILAVDDDPVNLKVLSHILPDEQYEVEVVASGKEALQQLALNEWDLIISDVMMPMMSGYELTRAIREKFSISELPILLLTARSQPEDIYAGFLAGANDYITKPVDALELNVRVHALTNLKASIKERLGMEAAWLQAQIRPHFLFNTLNTIISLSEIDIARMARLLEQFGYYLRNSFDIKNLDRVVPLTRELELLESYLYIEQERFGDRLKINWEIDNVSNIKIPPLSLQTVVENAVNHGVLKRVVGGTITICIRQKDDCTEIAVIDDGVGMDEEEIKQIFTPQPNPNKGIGLVNTDQRLKQLYGKGLQIRSTPGIGTTITFTIPTR